MDTLKQYRKALGGAIAAACAWFATSFADGGIEAAEWAVLPLAIFVTGGLVAVLKNEPSPEQLEGLAAWKLDPEAGAVTIGEIVTILAGIFFVTATLWFCDNAGWLWFN